MNISNLWGMNLRGIHSGNARPGPRPLSSLLSAAPPKVPPTSSPSWPRPIRLFDEWKGRKERKGNECKGNHGNFFCCLVAR